MKNLLPIALIVLLLGGCSSASQKKREAIRDAYEKSNYVEGLKLVEELNPREDEKSGLLYFMEKGMFYQTMGKPYLSSLYFAWADELSRKLYTESISKKAMTMVANDTFDVFYGAIYERSLIHYYQALNFFDIYQNGKIESYTVREANPSMKGSDKELDKEVPGVELSTNERQKYLFKARAEILSWDGLLTTWQQDRQGKTVFKNDLLAKILGGFIHEAVGTSADRQIALQLYKDAKLLLLKNYNAYVSLNLKADSFRSNFSHFSQMSIDEVTSSFVAPTAYQKELQNFLDNKIKSMDSSAGGSQANAQKVPVSVIVEMGMVPAKVARKVNIGFQAVLDNIEDPKTREMVAIYGTIILADFVASVLGLYPDPNNWNAAQAYGGLAVGAAAVNMIGFAFELPEVKATPVDKRAVLQVYDEKSGNVLVQEMVLPLVQPLGDIAEQAIAEDATSRYLRTGVRVGAKHLTAILSAFATYKMMSQQDQGGFFAKSAATLQYAGLSKAIEATEKADLRYWSTLPREIRSSGLFLPPGSYLLKVKTTTSSSGAESVTTLGKISVTDKDKNLPHLFHYRLKQS